MPHWDGQKLLAHMLDGNPLPAEFLAQTLGRPVGEGQHLEYKAWEFIEKESAGSDLREYVAGFANADGGVLLIGVAESRDADEKLTLRLDGKAGSKRATNAERWVGQVLEHLRPWLSPGHRFSLLPHDGSPVIALAVARAPNMVWCVGDDRRPAYFLRMGDQTVRAPDWLHADIVLGRKARPAIEVRQNPSVPQQDSSSTEVLALLMIPTLVTNQSLVWADKARFGCVGWMAGSGVATVAVSRPLREHLRVVDAPLGWNVAAQLRTIVTDFELPRPLEERPRNVQVQFPVPTPVARPYRWRGVIYVIPENCPPSFWQVVIEGRKGGGIQCSVAPLQDDELGVVSLEIA